MNINDFNAKNRSDMVQRIIKKKLNEGKFYHTCPYCGANLDPGEKCDCQQSKAREPLTKPTTKKDQVKGQLEINLDESIDVSKMSAEEIGKKLQELNELKAKHLEADDMPSFYFENIDAQIKKLTAEMEKFKCKCKKINESRLPSNPNKDPQFGVPEQKKFPLFDESHVRSAIKFFNYVDAEYEQKLARNIIAKMKKYNIPYDSVGKENKLYNYIPESFKNKKEE